MVIHVDEPALFLNLLLQFLDGNLLHRAILANGHSRGNTCGFTGHGSRRDAPSQLPSIAGGGRDTAAGQNIGELCVDDGTVGITGPIRRQSPVMPIESSKWQK